MMKLEWQSRFQTTCIQAEFRCCHLTPYLLTNYVLNLLFILNLYGQKFSTLVRCLPIFYNKKSNHICQPICRSTKQISTSSCTKIFTFASKCLVKEILFEFLNGAIPGVQCILVLLFLYFQTDLFQRDVKHNVFTASDGSQEIPSLTTQ